jgi:Protein of unknown function (DUF1573)
MARAGSKPRLRRAGRGRGGPWAHLCACALVVGAAHCETKDPGRQSPVAPRISCGCPFYDFGTVRQGDRLTHTFRIDNTGSARLRLLRVDRSESCAVATVPEVIAPAVGIDLEVTCDTEERPNRLVDKLVVHSDDPVQAELVLGVDARVEPRLAFTTRTVDLTMPFGENGSQDVWLTGHRAIAARLEVLSIDPPGPEVTVLPPAQGKPEGLRLAMAGGRVGRVAGQVVVATGLEKPKELTLLYSWQVLGNVTVDPTNPYIDLRGPGGGSARIKVASSRHDFRLDDARVIDGPFEATFVADEASHGYSVDVRVVASRVPPGQRGLSGKLRLISNDPAESQKEVPLFALGTPLPAGE